MRSSKERAPGRRASRVREAGPTGVENVLLRHRSDGRLAAPAARRRRKAAMKPALRVLGGLCHRVSPPGMRLAILSREAHASCAWLGGRMALRDQYRVLVVEDDPDIRRILQLFLTERDFT